VIGLDVNSGARDANTEVYNRGDYVHLYEVPNTKSSSYLGWLNPTESIQCQNEHEYNLRYESRESLTGSEKEYQKT
jgi:hypothetical protein